MSLDNFERVAIAWGFMEAELRGLFASLGARRPTDVEFILERIRTRVDDCGTCLPVNWSSDPRIRSMVGRLRKVLDDLAADRERLTAAISPAAKKARRQSAVSAVSRGMD